MSRISTEQVSAIHKAKSDGLTQREAAKKLNISLSSVGRYWDGVTSVSKGRADRPAETPAAARKRLKNGEDPKQALVQFALGQIEASVKLLKQAMAS